MEAELMNVREEIFMSPAYAVVSTIHREAWRETSRSWQRLNRALQKALWSAIHAGLPFSENDFKCIAENLGGAYWLEKNGGTLGEGFYAEACKVRNLSACHSFEKWQGRKPFIFDNDRLYVGREFTWEGMRVRVTSFNDDEDYAVACYYEWEPYEFRGQTHRREVGPRRIFRITHDDIYAERAKRRERAEKQEAYDGD